MNYHNITMDDMNNGPGIRTVLWLAGCSHNCPGCHNPITHDIYGGLPFDSAAKEELFKNLNRDYLSGITISGGDPLHELNRDEVSKLVKEIRANFPTKTIWVYTGFLYEEVKDLPLMEDIDVLCDGKFVIALKDNNTHWVGSTNQRVIDIKKTRKANTIVLFEDR